MAPKYRCTCSIHRCAEIIDPKGVIGRLLDAKTLRKHQQDEANSSMRSKVKELQTRDLKKQQDALLSSMKQLPVNTPPPTGTASYSGEASRIEVARKMLESIGLIQAEALSLGDKASSIGMAPHNFPSDHLVSCNIGQLQAIRCSYQDLTIKLKMIARHNKAPSVIELRIQAETAIDVLLADLGDFERSWNVVVHKREVEREAAKHALFADNVTEYNSGRPVIL